MELSAVSAQHKLPLHSPGLPIPGDEKKEKVGAWFIPAHPIASGGHSPPYTTDLF